MAKKPAKIPAEKFIAVVMKHADGTMQDVADELGVTHQAVSKRLREYRAKGVKGLPVFENRTVEAADLQALVDKHRKREGK